MEEIGSKTISTRRLAGRHRYRPVVMLREKSPDLKLISIIGTGFSTEMWHFYLHRKRFIFSPNIAFCLHWMFSIILRERVRKQVREQLGERVRERAKENKSYISM